MGRAWATVALLCVSSFAAAETETFRFYSIGASFMNDSHPSRAEYYSPWLGMEIESGYHIRGSSNTTALINNPTDATVTEEYGYYEEALTNHEWDALVVQVYPADGTGVSDDVQNLQYFASLMDNPDTPIYVYETWPYRSNYDDWELPLTDEYTQWRREYYHRVADELAPTIDNPVYIVPTGEVITTLAESVANQSLPGITNYTPDVYRDALHASSLSGALLSAVTIGTITGKNPIGTAPILPERLDPDQAANWDTLLAVAWQAAALEPRSPIEPLQAGDYNADGLVGNGDWLDFLSEYGRIGVPGVYADGNGDGVVNAADYVVLRESLLDTKESLAPTPEGDYNEDGLVDALDYEAYSSLLGALGGAADGNGDGVVNAADYAVWRESQDEFLALLESVEIGDYNGDGYVGASDRVSVFELYGMETQAGQFADGNGDGVINSLDYLVWRENIGATVSAATAIPEPSGAAGLLGCFSLLSIKRRGQSRCAR